MADHSRARACRVGLNLLFLQPGATGGMEIYARQLVAALVAARSDARLTLFVAAELARSIGRGDALAKHVEVQPLPTSAGSRAHRIAAEQTLLPRAARAAGVDVLHSLASTGPALTPGVRRVLTVHDLIHRSHPEAHGGVLAAGLRVLVPLAARRAHQIIAVSETTRNDVIGLLGVEARRVTTVPNGPGSGGSAATDGPELRARFGLGEGPLILAVSALRPHKNLPRLLRAFSEIGGPRVATLVLSGYPTAHATELRELAAQLGVAERVALLGWVDDADLEGLYREATMLAVPSLAEGFGLPVLEAMRRDLPVACSGTSSLAEIAGDAALLFDPLSVEEIASALRRLLADEDLRSDLVERGRRRALEFSWENAAAATWAVYDRVLSEPARSSPSGGRRASRSRATARR